MAAPAERARPTDGGRKKSIKFRNTDRDDCHRKIRERVAAYFATTGKDKYGDSRILWKAGLYGAAMVLSYGLILTQLVAPWAMLILAVVFGLSSLLLALNVSHDAAHNSLTRYKRLNTVLHTVIFGLLGTNAYLWQMRHVKSHHNFPNVNGCDADIDHNPFIRLSPNHPRRKHHRYQHLYAPLVYMFVSLHTIFVQDAIYLFKKRLANLVDIRHPLHEFVTFFVAKALYFAIVLVVPLTVLALPWWQVVAGYLVMSFVMSVFFVFMLIGTHFAEETVFPEVGRDGYIDHGWASHALLTSLDWNADSEVANFLVGGLNAHAAHHLFPTVCHVHYVDISRIISQTTAEYGVRYNETTLWGMVKSHFKFLKAVGRGDPVAA